MLVWRMRSGLVLRPRFRGPGGGRHRGGTWLLWGKTWIIAAQHLPGLFAWLGAPLRAYGGRPLAIAG
jgi:hypothetical protein